MKNRKLYSTLIALLLAVSMFFTACSKDPQVTSTSSDNTDTTSSEPTKTEEATDPSESELSYTPYQEYERAKESRLPECSFDEIVYERPDAQSIIDDFAELQKLVEEGATSEEILARYIPINDNYDYFTTMSSYAYIRFTLDLNDTYYGDEYTWCEEQTPLLAQAEEKCFIAMSKSSEREALESELFGDDFFDFYDKNQIFANDRVVELMQEEASLQAQYMALQSDQTVIWNGEEVLFEELVDDPSLSYDEYLEVLSVYCQKYNPIIAEIYIDLINVRNEIAAELGYETYADFAFSYYHQRDYTPEQVEQYLADIYEYMVPLRDMASELYYYADMTTEETMKHLEDIAYTLSGDFATAYDYMKAYGLYDLSESTSKMPGSYQTYLDSYEMPYMYVSPTNDIADLITTAHEFGHFVDAYVNCNGTTAIDCNEIFSQALEYLAVGVADLPEEERESLKKSQAATAVSIFLDQARYADFELQAYNLPKEELTTENLNKIFGETYLRYQGTEDDMVDYDSMSWFEVSHYFLSSHYVISYCVSLDAALQVYQCELSDGSGLDAFYKLLSLSSDNSILALLDEAGMTSPFAEERMKDLSEFLANQMK